MVVCEIWNEGHFFHFLYSLFFFVLAVVNFRLFRSDTVVYKASRLAQVPKVFDYLNFFGMDRFQLFNSFCIYFSHHSLLLQSLFVFPCQLHGQEAAVISKERRSFVA